MKMKRFAGGLIAGAMLILGTAPMALASSKTTTLKFYSKSIGQGFTTPAGKSVPESAGPAAGDTFLSLNNLYVGNYKHHADSPTASAILRCTVTAVTKTSAPATCEGVLTIGGAAVMSISTQNFGSSASTNTYETYPITAGTGKFFSVTGHVMSTDTDQSGDSDITLQYSSK
jgi:hypothetical protein